MTTSKSLSNITTQVRTLADAGAVATGNWTLAQISDHLARAVEGSLGLVASAAARKRPAWPVRMVGNVLVMRLGIVPRGTPAPEHVLPPADARFDQAFDRLQRAVHMFEQRAGEPNATLRAHPLFGFKDASSWRRFHLVHARHHLKFMKIAAPK
jgi:hypothetical protein